MFLGCDIGTVFTKAVLMENNIIQYYTIITTNANPDKAMERIFADILENKGINQADLDEIAVTGWGKDRVSIVSTSIRPSMLNCIGRGAVWAVPSCRSVLCVGAQQSLALSVNDKGRVMGYRTNDKCAAGSGRFLDRISEALEIDVKESSDIAKGFTKELTMSSQCAVFAESEVVSRVNDGEAVPDIIAAVLRALSRGIATLAKRIDAKEDCVLGGGLAKNETLIDYIKDSIQMNVIPFQPQPDLIGAVGAALHAKGGK